MLTYQKFGVEDMREKRGLPALFGKLGARLINFESIDEKKNQSQPLKTTGSSTDVESPVNELDMANVFICGSTLEHLMFGMNTWAAIPSVTSSEVKVQ